MQENRRRKINTPITLEASDSLEFKKDELEEKAPAREIKKGLYHVSADHYIHSRMFLKLL